MGCISGAYAIMLQASWQLHIMAGAWKIGVVCRGYNVKFIF